MARKQDRKLAMTLLFLICVLAATTADGHQAAVSATLLDVKCIWDESPHNAFTDLIFWKGQFVCAFREGRAHVSTDGRIRVLTSPDGNSWSSAASLALPGFDLRDASLSETPDGRLMLVGGAAPRKADEESAPTGSFTAFSDDAKSWTDPKIVVQPGRWLWRDTWHDGLAYGISYAAPDGHPFTSLLTSDDGLTFRESVPQLFGKGRPTEAALRFAPDGTLFCLQRRDGKPTDNLAALGVSQPPYDNWTWQDLDRFIGGPNFIRTPTGHWLAAGRTQHNDGPKTELMLLDPDAHTLKPLLTLPSGGDNSYPGLVWHDDKLWISYYSSHEGKAKIYLATIDVD